MLKRTSFCLISVIICASSCNLGPSYKVPATEIPDSWKTENNSVQETACVDYWWEIFGDEELNRLEAIALENNKDIDSALAKINRARAVAGEKGSDLYPQIEINPNYESIGGLVKIFGLPAAVPPLPTVIRTHQLFYVIPLKLQYELDLWGKLKKRYQAALFDAQAQVEAFFTVQLVVTSDLASHYFQMRSLDAQLEYLEYTIKVRKDAFDINQERYRTGFINSTDMTRAETLYFNALSGFSDLYRQRVLLVNAIAVLIGSPASLLDLPRNPLFDTPPIIPAGIPSEVLLRRPDIREAERKVASENALIGAAYANFFPSLNLTGLLGYQSPILSDFLQWESRLWALYGESHETVFDGYRKDSEYFQAWAQFNQASAEYQKTVLVAFKEVEDALNDIKYHAEQMGFLEKSTAAAKETTEVAKIRYAHGRTSYLDVADSERSELDTKIRASELLGKLYVSTIELIKALGGGWGSASK